MLKNRILLASFILFGLHGEIDSGGLHNFGGTASALGYREIAVGVAPHPSEANLILLQQGESSGLRIGDRGFLTFNGYAVTDSAQFQDTDIPFTIVELGELSATARLATPIQSLSAIAASITILDIHPTDLQPRNPNLPAPPPLPLRSPTSQTPPPAPPQTRIRVRLRRTVRRIQISNPLNDWSSIESGPSPTPPNCAELRWEVLSSPLSPPIGARGSAAKIGWCKR